MSSEDLMSIGMFSLRSGLSIPALRHYDEIGLLPPAFIDPQTGYRSYGAEQIRTARLICGLRAVDLPIEEVQQAVGLDDATVQLVLQHTFGDPAWVVSRRGGRAGGAGGSPASAPSFLKVRVSRSGAIGSPFRQVNTYPLSR